MRVRIVFSALLLCALPLVSTGCHAPGYPKPGPEVVRPEQVLDFPTLYKQNCAACHGADGKNGAAISLNNPVYLAVAGEANLLAITANGVPGTLMPPFASGKGGSLTDQQIENITEGMIHAWSMPAALSGLTPPHYASHTPGDPVQGQKAFITFCARCHGADGTGGSSLLHGERLQNGSLIDPSYLALVSDQNLRSIIIAGQSEQGMPNWRSDSSSAGVSPAGSHVMTDQEITDIVTWLASHRVSSPGQPYPQHP